MSETAAMSKFQLPWTRRAEVETKKRIESEERLTRVLEDWDSIVTSTHAVTKEVRLNDWTNTAKLLFTGTDGTKR